MGIIGCCWFNNVLLQRTWMVFGAALLAGATLPLAFAPFDCSWVAVLSPAVLFMLVLVAPRRAALWSVYLFGLGYFGTGISWVYVSISRYGSGPIMQQPSPPFSLHYWRYFHGLQYIWYASYARKWMHSRFGSACPRCGY